MRHILFFIESFSGGGAEKVLLTILRHLNYHRFEVTVLVMNDVGALYCDFHLNFIIGIGFSKIGRASCRERVCQYV